MTHDAHTPEPHTPRTTHPSRPQPASDEVSVGFSGFLRLCLALVVLAANVGLYTMLPIASLGLLPMLLASICLLSGTLDDLGLNR